MRCYPHFTLARGRSHGFGSSTSNSRPLQTRFRSGSGISPLTSLAIDTRRFILQKARCHPSSGTPTACKHTVSGALSLRSRGSFHRSLTVLFTIGRQVVFSLRRWSSLIQTGFLVSRPTWGHSHGPLAFSLRGSHPLRQAFPCPSRRLASPCGVLQYTLSCPTTLTAQRLQAITRSQFRLFPVRSPLLRESLLFSLPRGT